MKKNPGSLDMSSWLLEEGKGWNSKVKAYSKAKRHLSRNMKASVNFPWSLKKSAKLSKLS